MAIFISRVSSLHAKLSPLIYAKYFENGRFEIGWTGEFEVERSWLMKFHPTVAKGNEIDYGLFPESSDDQTKSQETAHNN